ncbi:putative nuclease HARBI1 [Manduca sexta]|uniref:DDE Tnp4 domain-containing protein n=1 Tax=Manduca sexta TaxID=7130 RepID=A0A921ZPR2_MANSE|nr:putative nuclease HARBI1 [Manduca sexta]KAG6461701.1 hypothetical protein O3G_MSEX012813 [Manduca sexta]
MNAVLLRRIVRRWRQQRTNIGRRMLRDAVDPLSLDPQFFIRNYRVTKDLFVFLCNILADSLKTRERCTGISNQTKILVALNFLATGSYQKPVGSDWSAPVSQPTASRCIKEVVEALNTLLPTFIKFPTSEPDKNKIKQGFYEKFGMPEVLGCVDGTLVAIIAPRHDPSEAAFFSSKGYHAINAAIISDSDLKIIGLCAKFGGAAHDSQVWSSWSISQYLEQENNNGKIGWLLGDSAYPQRPYLMTPVLHPVENTPEAHYTNMHVRARICVEQCIWLLKARWRCLMPHRVLHYKPAMSAKIINSCAILHNLCLNDGIEVDCTESLVNDDNDAIGSVPMASFADEHARQELIQNLWGNH